MDMPAGYDAWKTRSPDDERLDRCRPPYDGEDQPECEHPYWKTRWAFFNGKAICGECGHRLAWQCTRPFSDRVFDRWDDLRFWLRFDAWWGVTRPFRAVRSWWRGWRKAPWRPDDDIPF